MAWNYYTPGETVGPYRILEVIEKTPRQPTTLYHCALICCGKESEKSHAYIVEKASKGVAACRECYLNAARDADHPPRAQKRSRARKRSRAQKPAQPTAKPTVPAAPDAPFRKGVTVNGQFWPSLGPMGPRFGQQAYREHSGTGATRLMDQEAA